MLKMEQLGPISNIAAKIDIDELGATFEKIDMEQKDAAEKLGRALIIYLCKNIYKVSDEIIELVAANESISVEEARQLELMPAMTRLLREVDLKGFFTFLRG